MAKKNNIEHATQAYWREVQGQFEVRVKQAYLAGVKYGLTLVRTGDEDKDDAKD